MSLLQIQSALRDLKSTSGRGERVPSERLE